VYGLTLDRLGRIPRGTNGAPFQRIAGSERSREKKEVGKMNAFAMRGRRTGRATLAGAIAVAILCAAGWPRHASATVYTLQANLDRLQETPPIITPPGQIGPAGVAMVRYDDVSNTFLTIQSAFDGLTLDPNNTQFPRLVDSHFHFQFPGVQGPIIVPDLHTAYTETTPGFLVGNFTNIPFARAEEVNPVTGRTFETDLLNNLFYYNAHSNLHPGGEIRGQLIVVPEPASALLIALCGGSGLFLRRRRQD